MKPLVGVSAYTPRGYDGKAYALPCEYIDALQAAGANVVVLPGGEASALAARLDGLVLAGGGDIDARSYGAAQHETSYMVDSARDGFEMELAGYAVTAGLPLLAICRGMQILNIACGGTLVQHLPERFGERVVHRLPPREPVAHSVSVTAGSRLAEVTGDGTFEVMSWHHQAVDRVGDGLSAVAHAADGVIEALEAEVAGWLAAVQWHPELNAASSAPDAELFRRLSLAAEDYGRSRR